MVAWVAVARDVHRIVLAVVAIPTDVSQWMTASDLPITTVR